MVREVAKEIRRQYKDRSKESNSMDTDENKNDTKEDQTSSLEETAEQKRKKWQTMQKELNLVQSEENAEPDASLPKSNSNVVLNSREIRMRQGLSEASSEHNAMLNRMIKPKLD